MKKKLTAFVMLMVFCFSVLAGCSLIELNTEKYYEAKVCTITYQDGKKDQITKRELLMGYASYGYNYVQNYNYTVKQAVEQTLSTIVDQYLTRKAVEDYYKQTGNKMLIGSETTYLYDSTYDLIYSNLKSYFKDVLGIEDTTDQDEESEETPAVYTQYKPAAQLVEVKTTVKNENGEDVEKISYVVRTKTSASTVRETYETRKNSAGEEYDITKEYFQNLMYNKFFELTVGSDTGAKAWKSAFNKYVESIKENYKYKKFTSNKDCFLFEINRVYEIVKNNYIVEKYSTIFDQQKQNGSNIANMSATDILKYYSSKVREDYESYTASSSSFATDIMSSPEEVYYVPEGSDQNEYFSVGYVKMQFTEGQSALYSQINSDAYGDELKQEQDLNKLYESVKATIRDSKTGQPTGETIGADKLLKEIRQAIIEAETYTTTDEDGQVVIDQKATDISKATAFRKYLFDYSDDDTLKTAKRNTVFGVSTSGEVFANDTFSSNEDVLEAIKKLYKGGNAQVGDTTDLVRAEDGIYIFFYAGKLENLFAANKFFDASANEANILKLTSTRVNIFSEKTLFDEIYEKLSSSNFSVFQAMDIQKLRANATIVNNTDNMKDLY